TAGGHTAAARRVEPEVGRRCGCGVVVVERQHRTGWQAVGPDRRIGRSDEGGRGIGEWRSSVAEPSAGAFERIETAERAGARPVHYVELPLPAVPKASLQKAQLCGVLPY